MPYLSWFEGSVQVRVRVEDPLFLGRDIATCAVSRPHDPTVSRQHAALAKVEGRWWVRDLGSQNGTIVNGLAVPSPVGGQLQDEDEIGLGDWRILFTDGFPGLDGVRFIERVGNLFSEVRPEPSQALVLIQGMELLQRSVESLLKEGTGEHLVQGLLSEALKLLHAERGFIVMVESDGSWRRVGNIGGADDGVGLSHTILSYVVDHKTAVVSNQPMSDPRFQGSSVASMHRGALMCAPMMLDDAVLGMLYLDRPSLDHPFSRFDLALFQTFVRMGAVALRQTQLASRAISQAEMRGEMLRLRNQLELMRAQASAQFMEVLASARRMLSLAQGAAPDVQKALTTQVDHLRHVVEAGMQELAGEGSLREVSATTSLAQFQEVFVNNWQSLARLRGITLVFDAPPEGQIWVPPSLALHSLSTLVEPQLMKLGTGAEVAGRWIGEHFQWILRLQFPSRTPGPSPEAWTTQHLREAGITWRWGDSMLTLAFPMGTEGKSGTSPIPLLGLISQDHGMTELFEQVAESGGCALYPL